MGDTYERAKLSILSELLSFPTINVKYWTGDFTSKIDFQRGDLVSMRSAPPSKWYVSWVEDINISKEGWTKWLLKSIEDHSLCWWENIGLSLYDRKRISERPDWKWSDKQFKFKDRWHRVCFKKHDAHWILPGRIEFGSENSVRLTLRERFGGMTDRKFHFGRNYGDWTKFTMNMMSEFYLDGCKAKKQVR